MLVWRFCGLALIVLLPGGCGPTEVASGEPGTAPPPSAGDFDPTRCGGIRGRVTWNWPIPSIQPIGYDLPKADGSGLERRIAANPNRPRIDPATRALEGAIVYLKGIAPEAAKPWSLPAVTVEIGAEGIAVRQGNHLGRTGFVHRGDAMTLVSTESTFHILRARNDDFFSITLPTPDSKVSRILRKPGRVEFASGGYTGLSWMRADVFVCEHPYYTLADARGQFAFEQVPAGKFELVVWHPNWEPGQPGRDPESGPIPRQTYAPAFERTMPVAVEAGRTATVDISLP